MCKTGNISLFWWYLFRKVLNLIKNHICSSNECSVRKAFHTRKPYVRTVEMYFLFIREKSALWQTCILEKNVVVLQLHFFIISIIDSSFKFFWTGGRNLPYLIRQNLHFTSPLSRQVKKWSCNNLVYLVWLIRLNYTSPGSNPKIKTFRPPRGRFFL